MGIPQGLSMYGQSIGSGSATIMIDVISEKVLFVRRVWVIFVRDWKDPCIGARKATNGRTDEEEPTHGCDFISSRRNRDANSLQARALLYILSSNHARPCRRLGIPYSPSDLRHNEWLNEWRPPATGATTDAELVDIELLRPVRRERRTIQLTTLAAPFWTSRPTSHKLQSALTTLFKTPTHTHTSRCPEINGVSSTDIRERAQRACGSISKQSP
jgi:hypothetical protein